MVELGLGEEPSDQRKCQGQLVTKMRGDRVSGKGRGAGTVGVEGV